MYIGVHNQNHPITLTVTTHDGDGRAQDADAVPTYRLYDSSWALVASGSAAPKGDPFLTGIYETEIILPDATGMLTCVWEWDVSSTTYHSFDTLNTTGYGKEIYNAAYFYQQPRVPMVLVHDETGTHSQKDNPRFR